MSGIALSKDVKCGPRTGERTKEFWHHQENVSGQILSMFEIFELIAYF